MPNPPEHGAKDPISMLRLVKERYINAHPNGFQFECENAAHLGDENDARTSISAEARASLMDLAKRSAAFFAIGDGGLFAKARCWIILTDKGAKRPPSAPRLTGPP